MAYKKRKIFEMALDILQIMNHNGTTFSTVYFTDCIYLIFNYFFKPVSGRYSIYFIVSIEDLKV